MHRSIRWIAAVAVIAAGLATGTAQAAGPSTLAWGQVTGLKQSTGNLYWTTFGADEFGPDSASLWRASKFNVPGQEALLYRETRSDRFSFGDVTYAQVGTTGFYYGYIAANYYDLGIAQLKRVPLTGGSATVMKQVTGQIRDVDTDGSFLYWSDSGGLRRMPIGGGATTTLASGTAIGEIGLDATRVFYTSGTGVYSRPKAGGVSTLRGAGASAITALFVRPAATGTGTVVYWGERNGSVKSRSVGGLVTTTWQTARIGRTVTSVSNDGYWTLWSDCAAINTNQCVVVERSPNWIAYVHQGGVGTDYVQADAGAIFWGDVSQLRKYTR